MPRARSRGSGEPGAAAGGASTSGAPGKVARSSAGGARGTTPSGTSGRGGASKKGKAKPRRNKVSGTKTETSDTERSGASDRFIESQRKQLLAEREAYTRSATSLRAEADQLAEDREPGDVQFDEESGQGDSMSVERERDLALSAQALASVEEIDRALAKMDEGIYGVCEKCGEAIPKERLKALPHAALCVRCKSGGLSRR
ncbi:MAG: TraR/DksA C4-type zinc finger protein [Actinobacteria bacterium]|nr:TraR/DksA C4-type zinc finger protein [Actinomycetota bacterium]